MNEPMSYAGRCARGALVAVLLPPVVRAWRITDIELLQGERS
jgi:hypothetical protein